MMIKKLNFIRSILVIIITFIALSSYGNNAGIWRVTYSGSDVVFTTHEFSDSQACLSKAGEKNNIIQASVSRRIDCVVSFNRGFCVFACTNVSSTEEARNIANIMAND